MNETVLTPADQAFYEWFHVNGKKAYTVEAQYELFMAGWNARAAFIVAEEV